MLLRNSLQIVRKSEIKDKKYKSLETIDCIHTSHQTKMNGSSNLVFILLTQPSQ